MALQVFGLGKDYVLQLLIGYCKYSINCLSFLLNFGSTWVPNFMCVCHRHRSNRTVSYRLVLPLRLVSMSLNADPT